MAHLDPTFLGDRFFHNLPLRFQLLTQQFEGPAIPGTMLGAMFGILLGCVKRHGGGANPIEVRDSKMKKTQAAKEEM